VGAGAGAGAGVGVDVGVEVGVAHVPSALNMFAILT